MNNKHAKSFLPRSVFHRCLRYFALAVLTTIVLSGCGSGGGGGGGTTSGGTTNTSDKATITGTVSTTAGVTPNSLTIVSLGNTSSVSSTGDFSTEVYKDGVALVAAMPEGKEFGLMNVVATFTNGTSSAKDTTAMMKVVAASKAVAATSIELSTKTTAVAMVFLTPYFSTNDPAKATTLISIIENDPKVATLGTVINNVFNEADPLANPTLQNALGDAMASVLSTIEANAQSVTKTVSKQVTSLATVIQLPKKAVNFSNQLTKAEYSIDADYVSLSISDSSKGYNIDVDSRQLNTVDWIGEISQLNPSQFLSISDLTDKAKIKSNIYNRTPDQSSVIGRDRASAKGFLRWIDFIGTAIDTAFSYFFSDGVTVPSNTDGIYIVRAFSGGGWGADPGERVFLSQVPNGGLNDKKAFALNIVSVGLDVAGVVVDLKGVGAGCLNDVVIASRDSIAGQVLTFSSVNDLITFIPSVAKDEIIGLGSCVTKEASKNFLKFAGKVILSSAKEATKWVSQYKWFEIAASTGKIIERAVKLYEYATPLESVIVVVGSPFGGDVYPPSVPVNLSATAISSNQISLSWSASTDNVGVAGYYIYRDGIQRGSAINTSTTDAGLGASTQYCYTVSAYDVAGMESAQSSPQCATTQAAGTAPSAPTGINATAGNGQVTISWNAVSGVTYNLYMASVSGVTKSNYSTLPDGMKHSGVTSPYVHTGLTNGKTYYFVVTAVNANGESSESSQVSTTPQATSIKVWGAPQLIETGDAGDAKNQQIAMNASGTAIGVWSQSDGASFNIYANRYAPASGWGTAVLIETGTGNAESPQIAVAADDSAIAVWRQSDGIRYNILANRYDPASGWGTATVIEANANDAEVPQVAIDATGAAIVVWRQSDGIHNNIYANRYNPASGWGAAVLIETSALNVQSPQIAMAANGSAIAVWRQNDGDPVYSTRYSIYANRYDPASGWGTAALIENNDVGTTGDGFDIAMNENGAAVVVWRQWGGGSFWGIYANRYNPSSGWGTVELIGSADSNLTSPKVAMNVNGYAMAVWCPDIFCTSYLASHYDPASGWGSASSIMTALVVFKEPAIAMDANDNAVAAWLQNDSPLSLQTSKVNYYTHGSGWGTPISLSNPLSLIPASDYLSLAMDANGNAVVLSLQIDISNPLAPTHVSVYATHYK